MIRIGLLTFLLFANRLLLAGDLVLDKRIHHLRAGNEREWDRFQRETRKTAYTDVQC